MTHPPQLAPHTTLGVGGAARRLLEVRSEARLVDAVAAADEAGEPLLILGGGSNLVIADAGFAGTALRIATRGRSVLRDADDGVALRIAAGEPWDALVAATVRRGLAGLEALSGIPGSAGATPVQNVGAYGAEIASVLTAARVWDREARAVRTLDRAELDFGYRTSTLKRTAVGGMPRFVVLSVDLELVRDPLGGEVRYAQLAHALGVPVGDRAPAAEVRRHVLALRASKGMVLDPEDPDTRSTGSFFTNPVVPAAVAASLPSDAPRHPAAGGAVKLSAAWLVEGAGFPKGFGLPGTVARGVAGTDVGGGRASLSTKHALAITNRGDARAADVLAVARTVRAGVLATFGVRLEPEPVLVGCTI